MVHRLQAPLELNGSPIAPNKAPPRVPASRTDGTPAELTPSFCRNSASGFSNSGNMDPQPLPPREGWRSVRTGPPPWYNRLVWSDTQLRPTATQDQVTRDRAPFVDRNLPAQASHTNRPG
ncbi:hypothetical protein MYU51_014387 [Penicillium brevicompactum]